MSDAMQVPIGNRETYCSWCGKPVLSDTFKTCKGTGRCGEPKPSTVFWNPKGKTA